MTRRQVTIACWVTQNVIAVVGNSCWPVARQHLTRYQGAYAKI